MTDVPHSPTDTSTSGTSPRETSTSIRDESREALGAHHDSVTDQGAVRARVIVVSGASGSGKTRLARQLSSAYGWPFVNLDDFYRDLDEPGLPRLAGTDEIDWDDVGTWNIDAAVDALEVLCRTGTSQVPVYSITVSQRTGMRTVRLDGTRVVVAEGIFAPHVIRPLERRGLLEQPWCLHRNRAVTALRRLARDLAEHRKPPGVLLRRGWRLCRSEPELRAAHAALGAQPVGFREALARADVIDHQGKGTA